MARSVLITGAAGNLGGKLRRHLEGRRELRLVDIAAGGDPGVTSADLARWDERWAALFRGVDVVVHLAADATAAQVWPKLVGPNIDALINVYEAAAQAGCKRVVFASSNHVMGGYQDLAEPARLTTDIPALPGTRYVAEGERRDSTPYGAAKFFGERLGKCYADTRGLETVAVRIGWIKPAANRAEDIPPERGEWFRLMWISNRDFCSLMERAIDADLPSRFVVVNGMSANTAMRWDIDYTRRVLGYEPKDDVSRKG